MSMQLPIINLNGTSRADLLDQYSDAVEVLAAAGRALACAAPNARDYPTAGPGPWRRAVREHEDRCRRVEQVRREVEELADAVYDTEKAGVMTVDSPIRPDDDPTKIYWTARVGVDRLWVIDGYCLDADRLKRALVEDASFSRIGEVDVEIEAGPGRDECLEIAADACEGDAL